VREHLGAAVDPIGAFRASGYTERIAAERAGGTAAAWA
jgi:L-rhamnose isomerase